MCIYVDETRLDERVSVARRTELYILKRIFSSSLVLVTPINMHAVHAQRRSAHTQHTHRTHIVILKLATQREPTACTTYHGFCFSHGGGRRVGWLGAVGGRKRRHDLWTYFQYNPAERRTECLVSIEGEDGVSRFCGPCVV